MDSSLSQRTRIWHRSHRGSRNARLDCVYRLRVALALDRRSLGLSGSPWRQLYGLVSKRIEIACCIAAGGPHFVFRPEHTTNVGALPFAPFKGWEDNCVDIGELIL